VFRFVAVYFAFYLIPYVLHFYPLPGTATAGELVDSFWRPIVPWIGRHILGLSKSFPAYSSGGGDSVFDWIRTLCYIAIAAIVTLIWSASDRHANYQRLHDWLRVYVRYSLAAIMLSYGISKVLDGQFPFPGLGTLISPYGSSSGQDLLWTFMGYSRPYTVFAGLAETVGALLLLFRRTTLLGALILVAALTNVVILNFSYDVDIKLFSTNLLLMAVFLIAPDASRLTDLLISNRPTLPRKETTSLPTSWLRVGKLVGKSLLIGYAALTSVNAVRANQQRRVKPPLYGIWEVENFVRNGQSVPALTTETERWRYVVFGATSLYNGVVVKRMNDTFAFYREDYGGASQTVTITVKGNKSVFSYSWSDPEHLSLAGIIGGESLAITLARVDETKMRLVQHEFRWVR